MFWSRIRGILGVSVTWALVWGTTGAALRVLQIMWLRLRDPAFQKVPITAMMPLLFGIWAILGALAGAIFAGLIIRFERRGSVTSLSRRRVAVWGALGGASLPLLAIVVSVLTGNGPGNWLSMPLIAGGLGAATSVATLRLAQRAQTIADPQAT